MATEYVAGRTNIGDHEVHYRRVVQGWGGLVLTIALLAIIYFFNFYFLAYLVLFIPIYISLTGFYQARQKFCIAYGKSGVCNVSSVAGETRDVIGRLNRNKDSKKANKMIATSFLISSVITLTIAFMSTR